MTLPENFSHWQHLKDMLRLNHNKLVAHYFRDLGPEWKPDISTNRGALRTASTIDDNDTSVMTLIRLYLFHEILGYSKSRLGVFYGIPSENFQESVQGVPQVFMYFSQDNASVPDGTPIVDAEYSFRLMDETSASMTQVKALSLAKKIKQEFVSENKGIVFTKGKIIYKYYDEDNGYRLRIYGSTESDAIDVIKRMLAVQNHSFEEDYLTVSTPKAKSVNKSTKKELVYGKQRTKKRYRPTANVRFKYAYLYIHGLNKPIYLVDLTGRFYDALV